MRLHPFYYAFIVLLVFSDRQCGYAASLQPAAAVPAPQLSTTLKYQLSDKPPGDLVHQASDLKLARTVGKPQADLQQDAAPRHGHASTVGAQQLHRPAQEQQQLQEQREQDKLQLQLQQHAGLQDDQQLQDGSQQHAQQQQVQTYDNHQDQQQQQQSQQQQKHQQVASVNITTNSSDPLHLVAVPLDKQISWEELQFGEEIGSGAVTKVRDMSRSLVPLESWLFCDDVLTDAGIQAE